VGLGHETILRGQMGLLAYNSMEKRLGAMQGAAWAEYSYVQGIFEH
jgi:hypothetical protein